MSEEIKKKAQADGDCNVNMDIEYQNAIKSKMGKGMTENEAILKWLDENQKKNRVELDKKQAANEIIWKKWFGRPV